MYAVWLNCHSENRLDIFLSNNFFEYIYGMQTVQIMYTLPSEISLCVCMYVCVCMNVMNDTCSLG